MSDSSAVPAPSGHGPARAGRGRGTRAPDGLRPPSARRRRRRRRRCVSVPGRAGRPRSSSATLCWNARLLGWYGRGTSRRPRRWGGSTMSSMPRLTGCPSLPMPLSRMAPPLRCATDSTARRWLDTSTMSPGIRRASANSIAPRWALVGADASRSVCTSCRYSPPRRVRTGPRPRSGPGAPAGARSAPRPDDGLVGLKLGEGQVQQVVGVGGRYRRTRLTAML